MSARHKYYVGLIGIYPQVRLTFALPASVAPTPKAVREHIGIDAGAVIGPFRTKRGAEYMAANPCCETVADAERAARCAP